MPSATTSAATKTTQSATTASKPGPKSKTDAQSLLKADHRKVEQIFAQYEQNEDEEQKRKLARQVCLELIVHTKLEEELFYPACREKQVDSDMLDEAQVEHDGAKLLIADLLQGEPGDEFYDAKVKTLSEYIKHHVSEEEKPRTGIFAKAQKAGVDMTGLGQKIQARKMELMSQSEALCSRPPQPRSIHVKPQQPKSQEDYSMARNSNDRDRDERGRFTDDDDDRRSSRGGGGRGHGGWFGDSEGHSRAASEGRGGSSRSRSSDDDDDDRGRGSSRGGRGHGGWFGDSEGHSQASREGWEDRGSSRSRGYDDDDRSSSRSSRGGGRGQGGWFGDPEGHSEASRRGWEHSSHEGSGWYGDPRGHSEASRRGWEHSDHEGSGWYGDPQGHSQASREGWEDRGSSRSSRSSRGRDDDDDRGGSRGGRGGGRGHGGWFGDSEGHSQASREGWRDR
jgi:hemerythrin superfamily protein